MCLSDFTLLMSEEPYKEQPFDMELCIGEHLKSLKKKRFSLHSHVITFTLLVSLVSQFAFVFLDRATCGVVQKNAHTVSTWSVDVLHLHLCSSFLCCFQSYTTNEPSYHCVHTSINCLCVCLYADR